MSPKKIKGQESARSILATTETTQKKKNLQKLKTELRSKAGSKAGVSPRLTHPIGVPKKAPSVPLLGQGLSGSSTGGASKIL